MSDKRIIVGDVEADGLLDTATKIWCTTFYNINHDYYLHSGQPHNALSNRERLIWMQTWLNLNPINYLVLHNGLGYDVPLIKKVENIVLPTNKIIDTMILSKMFFPDIGGHAKPHSIEAWGQRFGIPKPEHEDWSQFSPEMLHRNKEDVRITTMLFHHLVHHGFDINGL